MTRQIKLSSHAVKELSIEKRAELYELPDVLNVFEIASLVYKDDEEQLTALIKTIIEACKNIIPFQICSLMTRTDQCVRLLIKITKITQCRNTYIFFMLTLMS